MKDALLLFLVCISIFQCHCSRTEDNFFRPLHSRNPEIEWLIILRFLTNAITYIKLIANLFDWNIRQRISSAIKSRSCDYDMIWDRQNLRYKDAHSIYLLNLHSTNRVSLHPRSSAKSSQNFKPSHRKRGGKTLISEGHLKKNITKV